MNSPLGKGRFRRWLPRLLVLFCGGIVLIAFAWRKTEPSDSLPVDRVIQSRGLADESRCIECHVQAETFFSTGHARTLRRSTDQESLQWLRQFADRKPGVAEGVSITFPGDRVLAAYAKGTRRNRLELDWCFGSGRHARTWVGTLSDSWGGTDLVEFRWTWYHALDGFGITPGQPEAVSEAYFGGLGLLYDHPKTRRCFGCHSSYLELEEGHLNEQTLHAGVTCQRCHGPRQRHIETVGEIRETVWQTMDHEESVRRCAQCHRRTEEMDTQPIRPDNKALARFQPIGLTQSRCFQSPKMTCVICHDPHVPLEDQNLTGIWQCVQCHDGAKQQTTCSAGREDDCLRCHMPKVRADFPLDFTDHWIRVRSDSPAKAAHPQGKPAKP